MLTVFVVPASITHGYSWDADRSLGCFFWLQALWIKQFTDFIPELCLRPSEGPFAHSHLVKMLSFTMAPLVTWPRSPLRMFLQFCKKCYLIFTPCLVLLDFWGNVKRQESDFQQMGLCSLAHTVRSSLSLLWSWGVFQEGKPGYSPLMVEWGTWEWR